MRIALWALQSPINIGMILRTAEVYRVPVTIFDEHGVLDDARARETISDFACGALERQPPTLSRDARQILASPNGRLVATALTGDSVSLPDAGFGPADVILVGNEYDGLPDEIDHMCGLRVRIPMPAGYLPKPVSRRPIDATRSTKAKNDGTPSLNVAVAASIIMSFAYAVPGGAPSLARPPLVDRRRG